MNIIKRNIYNDILEISDIGKQKEYWFGKNEQHISSFVEVMNRLFDDNSFDLFVDIKAREKGFSEHLISLLEIFLDELNNYQEKESDEEIIKDPKWQSISMLAKKIIDKWNEFDPKIKGSSQQKN